MTGGVRTAGSAPDNRRLYPSGLVAGLVAGHAGFHPGVPREEYVRRHASPDLESLGHQAIGARR